MRQTVQKGMSFISPSLNKNRKNAKGIAILLAIVAIFLELFVFNFRTIQSFFCGFDGTKNITVLENAIFQYEEDGWVNIYLENINSNVSNMYLGIDYLKENNEVLYEPILVNFQVIDEGNALYHYIPSVNIFSGIERSRFIKMNSFGKTNAVHISMPSVPQSVGVRVNSIRINTQIPFSFSSLRLTVVLTTLISFYIMFPGGPNYNISFSDYTPKKQLFGLIAISSILILIYLANINPQYDLPQYFTQYHKISESLNQRHLYLNDVPAKALATMNNPYDPAARDKVLELTGESYLLDHAYYNGKYYMYFGVVPALIIFLPFYLIAGTHISVMTALSIVAVFFVLSAYVLMDDIFEKWYFDSPLIYNVLCKLLLVFGSGAVYAFRGPQFYGMPIITGLTFAFAALHFCFTALRSNKQAWRHTALSLSGLCAALSIGCRPQLIMVFSILGILLLRYVAFDKSNSVASTLKMALFFAVPVIGVALLLMAYNYFRFGSIADFGANYNLTGNDMTHRGFHFDRIFLGIYYYFFINPVWSPVFPFITESIKSTSYMGFTWFEGISGGYVANHLVTAICFLTWKIRKLFREKAEYCVCVLCVVATLVVVIMDTEMAGIFSRYIMDFGWLMCIATTLTICTIRRELHMNTPITIILDSILLFSVGYSMLYEFMLLFADFTNSNLLSWNPEAFFYFRSIIQFW